MAMEMVRVMERERVMATATAMGMATETGIPETATEMATAIPIRD
jgi:hypothetical protein